MNQGKAPFLISAGCYRDSRGIMGILEDRQIPFKVKRIFWITQVPENTRRGGHAHKSSEQILICTDGVIEVELEDFRGVVQRYQLQPGEDALYIPSLCWGKFLFTANTRALCMASDYYQESDYIRDYGEFEKLKNANLGN